MCVSRVSIFSGRLSTPVNIMNMKIYTFFEVPCFCIGRQRVGPSLLEGSFEHGLRENRRARIQTGDERNMHSARNSVLSLPCSYVSLLVGVLNTRIMPLKGLCHQCRIACYLEHPHRHHRLLVLPSGYLLQKDSGEVVPDLRMSELWLFCFVFLGRRTLTTPRHG